MPEIRSVFDAGKMIAPDDVRGKHATLEEAVLAGEWPSVEAIKQAIQVLSEDEFARPVPRQPNAFRPPA